MIALIIARISERVRFEAVIWWLLCMSFLVWPFWGFELFHIGSFGVTCTMALSALAMVLWAVNLLVGRGEIITHRSTYWVAFLVLSVACAGFSIVFDGAPWIAKPIRTTAHLLFLIASMLVWASAERPPAAVLRLFQWWIRLAVVVALFGMYQMFARLYHLPLAWLELTNVSLRQGWNDGEVQQLSLHFGNFFRATSVFSEPSTLGLYCVQTLLMIAAASAAGQGNLYFKSRLMRTFAVLTLLVALFVTYSLGAMLTALVLMILLVSSLTRSRRWVIIRTALAGIIVFVAVDLAVLRPIVGLSISQLTIDRARGIMAARESGDVRDFMTGESFSTRVRSIREGARIWSEYPLIGAGLGRYGELSRHALYNDTFYFRVLAELGVLGLVAVVGFIVSVSVHLYRAARRLLPSGPEWVLARTMAYTVTIQLMIGFLTDVLHAELFWMEIGIALLVLKQCAPRRDEVVALKA